MSFQRCAIYTRQSRQSRGEFTSCEAQYKVCFIFAASMQREGWRVVDERYDDVGQSSETLDRPALNRLYDDLRSGKIDRVLVHRLDRVARKILFACQFLELLRQYDVALTVVSQPEITADANGKLLINLMATFAEFEQEMTRSRMTDARAALKAHGRRVAGRVPFGYFADPTTKQLIVSHPEATCVRAIFKWAAEGRSLAEIADAANKQGRETTTYANKRRSQWTPRRISALLANRQYLGQIRYGDKWLAGLHEPVIDEQLYNLAHEQVGQRRTKSSGRRNRDAIHYALAGLIDCPKCGRKLSIGTDVKRLDHLCRQVIAYYRCRSNAGGRKPCSGVRVQTWALERRVSDAIGQESWGSAAKDQVVYGGNAAAELIRSWKSLDSLQQGKLLPLIFQRVLPTEKFASLEIYLKVDAYDYVGCMLAYGQPKPPDRNPVHRGKSLRRKPQLRIPMNHAPDANSVRAPLRDRLKRANREELFYDDGNSTPMLIQRCEITVADIPKLIDVVAEDLVDCDPVRLGDLRFVPEPDGNERDWKGRYLLAAPTDDWVPAIVAYRALLELKAKEAIPLSIRLLFRCRHFPRLSIDIEAERFFAVLGQTAIAPLVEAFEQSEPDEDHARRNIAASLGKIAQLHGDRKLEITSKLVQWLGRYTASNIESNSEIVCVLLDLRAVEAKEAIWAALTAGCLDERSCGDWDEIRAELS